MTRNAVLLGCVAVVIVVLTAGTASALRSLSFSKREIALLQRELSLKFPGDPICEIGVNMTLNSTSIPKTSGAVIGRVSTPVLRCSGPAVTVLNSPWNLKYVSISGTLPNISSFTIEIERWQIRVGSGGLECLVTAEMSGPQAVAADGRVGAFTGRPFILRNRSISGICTGREIIEGEFGPINGPITLRLL